MAAEMLSDEQISDFKDAFTHFDLGQLILVLVFILNLWPVYKEKWSDVPQK